MSNIKISELNPLPGTLSVNDFFPVDKSSSLLTYRTNFTQVQSLLSTGSFTGSFTGNLVGTSSWSNNTISASYASASTSASYALTSSYAVTASYLNGGIGITGNGTATYLPIWLSNTSLGNSDIYYTASLGYVSSYKNISIENGQAFFSARGTFNCGYVLQSMYTASDAWQLSCGTENTGSSRGIFELSTYSGSNQLISKQSNDPDGYGTVRALRIAGNGFYFWPLGGSQTVSRDGTFNIGVDSGTANTETRFLIHVYSGSSASNPQTYHIQKAIEVQYGSSSLTTTFCVSSSGQVIATGYSGSNFSVVNFYGSASYALTSSTATTASYALTSSTATTASYALTSSTATTASYALTSSTATTASYALSLGGTNNPMGILSVTSSLAANNYKGSAYSYSHGLSTTPYYFKCVVLCVTDDTTAGYVTDDEVESVALYDSSTNNEHTAITAWANKTYLGASCLNNGWLVNNKANGNGVTLDPTLWKIKFYYR